MIPSNVRYSNSEKTPEVNDEVSFKLKDSETYAQGRIVHDGITTYVEYVKVAMLEDIEDIKFKDEGENLPS